MKLVVFGSFAKFLLYNRRFPQVDVFDFGNYVGQAVKSDPVQAIQWSLYNLWELYYSTDEINDHQGKLPNGHIGIGFERYFLDYNWFPNERSHLILREANRVFAVPVDQIPKETYSDSRIGIRGMYPGNKLVEFGLYVKGQRFPPESGKLWGENQGLVNNMIYQGWSQVLAPFDPDFYQPDDVLLVWVRGIGNSVQCFWLKNHYRLDYRQDREFHLQQACQNAIDMRSN